MKTNCARLVIINNRLWIDFRYANLSTCECVSSVVLHVHGSIIDGLTSISISNGNGPETDCDQAKEKEREYPFDEINQLLWQNKFILHVVAHFILNGFCFELRTAESQFVAARAHSNGKFTHVVHVRGD